jgi:hypothetical protein
LIVTWVPLQGRTKMPEVCERDLRLYAARRGGERRIIGKQIALEDKHLSRDLKRFQCLDQRDLLPHLREMARDSQGLAREMKCSFLKRMTAPPEITILRTNNPDC